MGCAPSTEAGPAKRIHPTGGAGAAGRDPYSFHRISDQYESLEEVEGALRKAGLESSNLIVAVDFTKSNLWTGKQTFGGRSLHWIDPKLHTPEKHTAEKNPYIFGMECIATALAEYDDDHLIPVFGFGDSTTGDKAVFPFYPDRPARGFREVLDRYMELAPKVHLAGPTNFAPAIEAAIQIVDTTKAYHILLILADGQVTSRAHTEAAIVRASAYPLSIILVGVGDGPWEEMIAFDDELPARKFDNFREYRCAASLSPVRGANTLRMTDTLRPQPLCAEFVCMSRVMQDNPANPGVAFALACLMEIPEQYAAIRALGYL